MCLSASHSASACSFEPRTMNIFLIAASLAQAAAIANEHGIYGPYCGTKMGLNVKAVLKVQDKTQRYSHVYSIKVHMGSQELVSCDGNQVQFDEHGRASGKDVAPGYCLADVLRRYKITDLQISAADSGDKISMSAKAPMIGEVSISLKRCKDKEL